MTPNSPKYETIGLSSLQVEDVRKTSGWNEVTEEKKGWVAALLSRFSGLSAWMIEAIVVLSLISHRLTDAGVAFFLLVVNALLGFFQERRASNTVELLRRRLEINAKVMRDGRWRVLAARELVPGDILRLRLGDIVPADVEVLQGDAEVDQSALTGESIGVARVAGGAVYSGSLIQRGDLTAKVAAIGAKTYFGKTVELVKVARPKLHLDEIVGRLVRWLFLVVGAGIAVTLIYSLFRGESLPELLSICLVLLMSAVPVALPVMFSVSTAVAARALGDRGVLVTRLSAAEDAATMDTLCVDKTGTVTENRIVVAALRPAPGVSEVSLLEAAAAASDAAERDPIDEAILKAAEKSGAREAQREKFIPFSPETRRTVAIIARASAVVTVTKGAVNAVADWVGDAAEGAWAKGEAEAQGEHGYRSLAVAEEGKLLGLIALQDPPRPDSRALIERLHGLGIKVKMLTGDALPVAKSIATQIGLGTVVRASDKELVPVLECADGIAEVYPETKYRVIEALQSAGHIVGMTGDGVNDAPSLKKAEVGIAVSTATDAAKSAASVVLTTGGLGGIVDLVENGRAVYQRILTWMINKLSRTVLKAGFVLGAYFLTGKFVISAIGMLLVVLMTDFAKIALATDRVRISPRPDTWNVGRLALLGGFLGLVMLAESIFLLKLGMHKFCLAAGGRSLHTFSFLLLLYLALFSILSIRERRFFWASMPSTWLLFALGADFLIGLFVGAYGAFELPPLAWATIGFVIGGSAVFALVLNDLIKVAWIKVSLSP